MAEYGGVFEELAGRDHRVETGLVDEHVIGAIGLAGTRRAGGDRDRARQRRIALDEKLGDRCLAGAPRARTAPAESRGSARSRLRRDAQKSHRFGGGSIEACLGVESGKRKLDSKNVPLRRKWLCLEPFSQSVGGISRPLQNLYKIYRNPNC
jgi:hypothetical protein